MHRDSHESPVHFSFYIRKFRGLVDRGKMTLESVGQSYASWTGHISHGNTYHLRQNIPIFGIKGGGAYLKIYRPEGRCNISGERVRAARERAGISQERLAYKIQIAGLDITQKAISRIETGDRVVADYELEYLADALGVTIYYLLGKE